MILVHQQLTAAIQCGLIHGTGYVVGPASIDLTLGDTFLTPIADDTIARPALGKGPAMQEYTGGIILEPGQCCLAVTSQIVRLPLDCMAQLLNRSTVGRCFLNHNLAGWIDPGFHGAITLEFRNDLPIRSEIRAGDRLVQIVVHRGEITEKGYASKYQGDMGISTAKASM